MDTCLYEVVYESRCSWSMAFDNMSARCIVEAPARIFCWDLEKLLAKNIDGFRRLRSFCEVKPVKLV